MEKELKGHLPLILFFRSYNISPAAWSYTPCSTKEDKIWSASMENYVQQTSTTNSTPTQDTAPTTQGITAGQSHDPATAEPGMS
jgi:hypothetical protein